MVFLRQPSPALKSSHPELFVASQCATIVQPASGSRDNSSGSRSLRRQFQHPHFVTCLALGNVCATAAPTLRHHCATAAPSLYHRCTPVLTDEDSTNPPVPQVTSKGKLLIPACTSSQLSTCSTMSTLLIEGAWRVVMG